MGRYTPSQCLFIFITLSTSVTVVGCVLSALVLFLAPEEDFLWQFRGGKYTLYPGLGLVVSAVLALVISTVGCCGVCKDSKLILLGFSLGSIAIAMLQLSSSTIVFTFSYTDEIENQLGGVLREEMYDYSEVNSTDSSVIEKIQIEHNCCGAYNYSNWIDWDTLWRNETTNDKVLAPQSCCLEEHRSNPDCTEHSDLLNHRGCVFKLVERLQSAVDAVLGLSVIIAVLLFIASGLGYYGAFLIGKYQQYDIL